MQLLADELKLEKDALDTYLGSLNEAAAGDSDMTVDQVKAMFAADGEAVDIDDEAEPAEDAELAAILAAAEPQFTSATAEEMEMAEVGRGHLFVSIVPCLTHILKQSCFCL